MQPERKDYVKRLLRRGVSQRDVAQRMGVARSTIWEIAKAAGIKRSGDPVKPPAREPPIIGYDPSAPVEPCPQCGRPSRLPARPGVPCVACQVRAYGRKRKEPTP